MELETLKYVLLSLVEEGVKQTQIYINLYLKGTKSIKGRNGTTLLSSMGKEVENVNFGWAYS